MKLVASKSPDSVFSLWFYRSFHSVWLSQWFIVHGTALDWFNACLSERLFCINCLLEARQSCYVLPQGSVLGPLLFTVSYTSQFLCSLVVSQSPQPMCWRHPVLFIFSSWPVQWEYFSQTTHSIITDTMTSDLSLNSAKTKLLLLGLQSQLKKIFNPAGVSFSPTDCAVVLCSILTSLSLIVSSWMQANLPSTYYSEFSCSSCHVSALTRF